MTSKAQVNQNTVGVPPSTGEDSLQYLDLERMESMDAPLDSMAHDDEPEQTDSSSASLKGQIETALFLTGKPLTIPDLMELLSQSEEAIEEALMMLIQDYAFREDSALEIDDTDGYILQVRETYQSVVDKMVPVDISIAALRTLSAIAIKSPILQSDLVELRGASVYENIPDLLARKLISKKRKGRSYLLNVTPTFHQYFKLTGDKKELEVLVGEKDPATSLPEKNMSEDNKGA